MAIIAGYAGVGKTWFAKNTTGAIEIPSMPYTWILPKKTDEAESELEKEKGAFYHLKNPMFPLNYVLEILKAESVHPYVIIPTVDSALEMLQEQYERECILVSPEENLKEEYTQRYRDRGNSESFMELFIGGWEARLKCIRANKGVHIFLAAEEYLSDVKPQIDNIIGKGIKPSVSSALINKIEEKLFEEKKDFILILFGMRNHSLYWIPNIEDDDIQMFLYQVGRLAYECNVCKPFILKEDDLPRADYVWMESQEEFMDAIRQNSLED